MTCDRARLLIDAYATDELDLAAALDVGGHLEGCPACAADLASLRALRRALAAPGLRHAAPPDLRRRLAAATDAAASDNIGNDLAAVASPAAFTPAAGRAAGRTRPRAGRFALAAAAVALLLPLLALYWQASRAAADRLVADLTAGHVRSLMGDHLLDVPSTDQHTVKPWFDGKLDFAPPVVDLAADGFPLVGGRLDYVDGRPVAAVVYRRHKHLINLFTWPAAGREAAPALSQRNGYNLLIWAHHGMAYAAVSDLNPQELGLVADRLRSGPATAP